jgi:RNA polymerase sigma factor (sigma-70 family)
MTNDAELLCRYANDRSDEAFAELVRRHVDLVYSSALRQTWGDHHKAQEVTQMVFIHLARKAAALVRHPVLPAWLHRSSHLAALELRRKESRRQKYEKAAGFAPASLVQSEAIVAWEEVRPVLDEALNSLGEHDRQAILLRYFANRPFGEVGEHLKLSENAARMRVERALEKLNDLLGKKGITSSSAALALALSGHAVAAAPAGVAMASTSAAMVAGGGAGLAWLAFMSTTKLPITLTAAILLAGGAAVGLQNHAESGTAMKMADLSYQNRSIPRLREANERLMASSDQEAYLAGEAAEVSTLRNQVKEAEAKASAAANRRKPRWLVTMDDGQPVIDISKLDQRPVMVAQKRPEYPQSMRQAGAQGEAVVQFVVGSDGLVYNVSAISSTDPAFADSAVQAVNQWIFKPGQVAGQNVHTQMQVPIVFALSEDDAPQPASKSWF